MTEPALDTLPEWPWPRWEFVAAMPDDDGVTVALVPIERAGFGRPAFLFAEFRAARPDVDALCRCIDVEIGSHAAAVALPRPVHFGPPAAGRPDTICVDACLADEIRHLWSLGIVTTGCCCGHRKRPGFIGVSDADIPRMKAMGYEVAPNPCRPGDEDSFRPRSLVTVDDPIRTDIAGRTLDSTGHENTFDG